MEEQLQFPTGAVRHHMPDEEGPTVVKLCSTSGAWPGLDLIKTMLVYEEATESSPDEESPYSKRHLRWIFLARVLLLTPPAWWAVAAVGMYVVTQHGPCLMQCL